MASAKRVAILSSRDEGGVLNSSGMSAAGIKLLPPSHAAATPSRKVQAARKRKCKQQSELKQPSNSAAMPTSASQTCVPSPTHRPPRLPYRLPLRSRLRRGPRGEVLCGRGDADEPFFCVVHPIFVCFWVRVIRLWVLRFVQFRKCECEHERDESNKRRRGFTPALPGTRRGTGRPGCERAGYAAGRVGGALTAGRHRGADGRVAAAARASFPPLGVPVVVLPDSLRPLPAPTGLHLPPEWIAASRTTTSGISTLFCYLPTYPPDLPTRRFTYLTLWISYLILVARWYDVPEARRCISSGCDVHIGTQRTFGFPHPAFHVPHFVLVPAFPSVPTFPALVVLVGVLWKQKKGRGEKARKRDSPQAESNHLHSNCEVISNCNIVWGDAPWSRRSPILAYKEMAVGGKTCRAVGTFLYGVREKELKGKLEIGKFNIEHWTWDKARKD
ncbi:hypothetical protein C8R45DRAFT_1074745 [Mycena sanguinolenta]|nr:hypothetical protein C8R45DRAFT_1074745 [Mycena sanguinolenta]